MIWVTQAKHIKDFELEISFNDGKTFRINLSESLSGEIFKPLNSLDAFKKFKVNADLDTVVWENGADFAPEFLYELGAKQKQSQEKGVG